MQKEEIWNGGDWMVDEKKLIRRIDRRIDDFVKKHPDKKNCEQIEAMKELIHLIELEAEEENG